MFKYQNGLTLLELLIVVSILSATALMAINTIDHEQDQLHFSDTQQRLKQIREVILGRQLKDTQSNLLIDGFVADMGRLPVSIKELTSKLLDCDADGTNEADADSDGIGDMCEWQFHDESGLWQGWRGPYLSVNADSNGQLSFRDGWKNQGVEPNYGWSLTLSDANADTRNDTMILYSLGKDGLVNPADVSNYDALSYYEQDYPPTTSPTVDPTLPPEAIINSTDHEVNLKGWKIHFHLINPCTPDVVIPTTCTGADLTTLSNSTADNLRIKLFYPENGQVVTDWPANVADRNVAIHLSDVIDISSHSVADNTEQVVVYDYSTIDKIIPWGKRSFVLVNEADGTTYTDNMINIAMPYPMNFIPKTSTPDIHIYWRLE